MDATFLQARITACEVLIVAYEAAILALSSQAVQSYTLNTGQTVQTVTRKDLSKLNTDLDGLFNRLATLEARRNGSGSLVVPAW